ncbi:protein translocase subunit SecD, partial [Pseudomonas aeruginosa]
GSPMKLGLDLSGGVHFLLEVDMDKAVDARLKVYESEVKSLLRKERVRYRSLPIQDRAIQLGFTDSESLDKARSLIAKDFRDFEVVPEERNGLQVLRVALTQAKLAEIREYSIKQNLTTVRNRVNELGVSEPLV